MLHKRYIEVEGDKPKVEPTREYFAAIYAGLKTAEEYAREMRLELETERAARVRAEEALRGIGRFAEAHHDQQEAHVYLHALIVDIPAMVEAALAAVPAENQAWPDDDSEKV